MTIRRLASICLLIFVNVLIGFFYLQTRRPVAFMNGLENETVLWNSSECASSMMQAIPHTLLPGNTSSSAQTRDPSQHVFPHPYQYIIKNSDLCTRGNVRGKLSLIILVCTGIDNFVQRQTIRETWGSVAASNNNTGSVRLAFLLGSTNNATLQLLLATESDRFSDIIQESFCDSYQNLTLKSVMLLKWTTEYCSNVHYVLKTDDDMYVNVAKLGYTLTRLPVRSKVMYGMLFRKAKPNRNSAAKWFVPKDQFQGDVFPDYLSGTGYVISRDVVPKLFEVSSTLPFLVMEDVFVTGLCASEAGVRRYNVRGFAHWRRPATWCAFRDAITGHHVSAKDMRKIWNESQKTKLLCRPTKKGS